MKYDDKRVQIAFIKIRKEFQSQIPVRIEKLQQVAKIIGKEMKTPDNAQELFRLAHNLVGAGRTFGFEEIARRAQKLANYIGQNKNSIFALAKFEHLCCLINDLEAGAHDLHEI